MSSYEDDFALKEKAIELGEGLVTEVIPQLFVKVVKAKELPSNSNQYYVEVKLEEYIGVTKLRNSNSNPEWNQVFAFSREITRTQSDNSNPGICFLTVLELLVKGGDFTGRVLVDLNRIPSSFPPDTPLTPQWYKFEDDDRNAGELMLAVWWGLQTDEEYPQALPSDAISLGFEAVSKSRSKQYLSPKLWYVRVNIISARDLPDDEQPQLVYVKAVLGNQVLRTKGVEDIPPIWNEELMFVVAEPFHEPLLLSVEEKEGRNLGKLAIPLKFLQRRLDHNLTVDSQWYDLERHDHVVVDRKTFASKIHLRLCLEGSYHVLDESLNYLSDLRPAAEQLQQKLPIIGILEVGILSARELIATKTRDERGGATDAYCVAKYGQKWVRTRTIVDTLTPKWNEQYTWDVFDLCTVLTVGVFDNGHLRGGTKDAIIGRVRIRLSTLEANRVYTHLYPLLELTQSGVRKTGELHLAVRFKSSSLIKTMYMYSKPLLPKMHYIHPLSKKYSWWSESEMDSLRQRAMQIVSTKLSQAELPLRKEVVEYMLGGVDSKAWSLWRSKAHFNRIMLVLSGLIAFWKWFDQIRQWRNPFTTVCIHIVFIVMLVYPGLILPAVFFYLFLKGIWNYVLWRPRDPPHLDTRLSQADDIYPDELDEELDTFPTSRPSDFVMMRYDRLRSIAGRVQTVTGDVAVQGEKLWSLISWRDPGATILFLIFCLISAILVSVIPSRVIAFLTGTYVLRHPRFRRQKLPSAPLNFFTRLPSKLDYLQ